MLLFFMFPQFEAILPVLDLFLVFTILDVRILLVVCELLEGVAVKNTPR